MAQRDPDTASRRSAESGIISRFIRQHWPDPPLMEKTYDPHAIEQRWYEIWESRGWFEPGSGDRASPIAS